MVRLTGVWGRYRGHGSKRPASTRLIPDRVEEPPLQPVSVLGELATETPRSLASRTSKPPTTWFEGSADACGMTEIGQ
jgi:hypothetical protein